MDKLHKNIRDSLIEIFPEFILSRAIFFLILVCVSSIAIDKVPSREGGNLNLSVVDDFSYIFSKLKLILLSADSSWYLEIAKYSYPIDSVNTVYPRHWVFFPAFPILLSIFSKIIGSYLCSAILLNFILFWFGLSFINLYLKESNFSKLYRRSVISLFCFHPFSYFFSTVHTESLFLFALSGMFYFLNTKSHKVYLYIFLTLMLLSRPTGILLLPGVFYLLCKDRDSRKLLLLIFLLSASTFLIYPLYLWELTGSPFSWAINQKAWGRGSLKLFSINEVKEMILPWNFSLLHFVYFLVSLSSTFYFVRLKKYAEVLLILVPTIVLISSGSLLSVTRILMPIFFIQMFVAGFIKSEIVLTRVLIVSSIMFALFTLLYCLHVTAFMA